MAIDEDTKLKNIINFYMLTNRLKNKLSDNDHSLADLVYGAMTLAIATNLEYNKAENIGEVLKIILLQTLSSHNDDDTMDVVCCMAKGMSFLPDMQKQLEFDVSLNENNLFAYDCMTIELMMEYFFEKILTAENSTNIEELYNIAKTYHIIDKLGNDENSNYEIFRFYYLNRALKKKERSGWNLNHWNIKADRIERVSEHVIGTLALAIGIDSEFSFSINLNKVITTLCLHEIGEIIIGDITPFDNITPEKKEDMEHKAMIEVLGNLKNKDLILNMLYSFDKQDELDSQFAHYCDKLEADIQAKIYQDLGYQHSLDDQENNIVFNSVRVQEIIREGAKSAFDIWYEYDKGIYTDEPVFTKILKYVKENNLK